MPKVFAPAESDVHDILNDVLDQHFTVLTDLQPVLKFDVLMVSNHDKDDNPRVALKRHGHPIVAEIKRTKPEERSKGGADLRIFIDAMMWDALTTDRQRQAALHSELHRIEISRDKHGTIKYDAYERVVVRVAPYDWVLCGNRETVAIFGSDATEQDAIRRVVKSLSQATLPFGEPDDSESPVAGKIGGEPKGRTIAAAANG